MGICGSLDKTKTPQPNTTGSGKNNDLPKQSHNKYARRVTIKDEEIVVAKLMVHKDRVQSRITKLDREEKQFKDKALLLAKSDKKDEAIYAMRQSKRCKEYKKAAYLRLEFMDKQLENIENAQDDAAFTKLLADSNRVIEKLNSEIDIEEIQQAKELQKEGKMRRAEIDELLGDDDDDIKQELDRIEAQIVQENFNNANINLGSKQKDYVQQENKNVNYQNKPQMQMQLS